MTTFYHHQAALRLYCHIGGKKWNPVEQTEEGARVSVARQIFPVNAGNHAEAVLHHVVHKPADLDLTADLGIPAIVLFVGSEPFPQSVQQTTEPPRFYMRDRIAFERVQKWLPEFLELTIGQANKLAGCKERSEAHEFENGFASLLDVILPGRMENRLAYRLLREAQALCNGQANAETITETGLSIHAPTDINQWLAIFDQNRNVALRTLARCIVDEEETMGNTASEPIRTNLSAKTTSDLQSLEKGITGYLKLPQINQTQA